MTLMMKTFPVTRLAMAMGLLSTDHGLTKWPLIHS